MIRVKHLRQKLCGDTRGVALIEFALVAPVVLFVILGGLELANYARAQMRVSQIAMTVADNSGRVTTGIDEANIYEVFAGAAAIGNSIDFKEHGRVILSSLEENGNKGSKKGQMIRWQRCWGNQDVDPAYGTQGSGANSSSLRDGMGPEGNTIIAGSGTAVMFVEASYDYQPLFANGLYQFGTIRHESAFNVRGRENQVISNAQNLSVMSCS